MSESLRRGLQVVVALAKEPATATQVATMTGVSLSTAVRLLQVLEQEGFTRRDATNRYRVGTRLLSTAYTVVASMDIREVAAPVLRALNRETGQTVHLGYFENPTLIYLDKYDGTAPVQMYSRIGQPAPLHCTAMGKAVAAFLPEDEQTRLASRIGYQALTEHTITTPEAYLRELRTVRNHGHALNLGEHEAIISAVAVPIIQSDGRVQHGIDLAVPNFLVSNDELRAFIPRVVEAAHEIEALLGYR